MLYEVITRDADRLQTQRERRDDRTIEVVLSEDAAVGQGRRALARCVGRMAGVEEPEVALRSHTCRITSYNVCYTKLLRATDSVAQPVKNVIDYALQIAAALMALASGGRAATGLFVSPLNGASVLGLAALSLLV